MDNVTHSLIGLIVGESAATHARLQGLSQTTRRTALLTVALVGSNTPDLDLLWSLRTSARSSLDYMLWHRGYTHTVLGCLALALMVYAGTELILRCQRHSPSLQDRLLLLGTAVLATVLHLAMDYLNSYGVHAFWPLDSRWQYGDRVFIVEPLYWAAAAPLFVRLRSMGSRLLFGSAILGVIVFGLGTHMVSPLSCLLLGLGFAALVAWGARLQAQHAARLSLSLALAVTAAFALAGWKAGKTAQGLALEYFPQARLIDHVLTPQPVNPMCWDVLLLSTSGDEFVARHAVLSLAPAVVAAAQCPFSRPVPHAAPWTPLSLPASAGVHWMGQVTLSRSMLKRLSARDCDAAAFLLFARAPFIASGLLGTVLGDLRFDRDGEAAEFEVPASQDIAAPAGNGCRRAAPWSAPRADLLRP